MIFPILSFFAGGAVGFFAKQLHSTIERRKDQRERENILATEFVFLGEYIQESLLDNTLTPLETEAILDNLQLVRTALANASRGMATAEAAAFAAALTQLCKTVESMEGKVSHEDQQRINQQVDEIGSWL